jgi:hypothetical protein
MIRQRLSMLVVALLATFGLVAAGAGPAVAAPAQAPPATTAVPGVPVTGTVEDGGTFNGVFTPTEFVAQDGKVLANGTLTGTLTDSAGQTIGTVNEPVSAPTAAALATCQVLDLVLGPLHLDLLGLVVDLNQVHLVINAESGPGNLLGNLLCAIAGLLDGTPSAGVLAALLNLLLALLNQS